MSRVHKMSPVSLYIYFDLLIPNPATYAMPLRLIRHCCGEGSRTPPSRPSFAACVNIKAYYFSISISGRTRNFLIYAHGRTAAAESKSRVVSLRLRARRKLGERRREGSRIRGSRVTNEADTHLCPAFALVFLLVFFPSTFLPFVRFYYTSFFPSFVLFRSVLLLHGTYVTFPVRLITLRDS